MFKDFQMSKNYTPEDIIKIKANAKVSQIILAHKLKPIHFNLMKAVITKIESISGVETSVPSEYKSLKVED